MRKNLLKRTISAVLSAAILLLQGCFPVEILGAEYGPFASDSRLINIDGILVYNLTDESICGASQYTGDYFDFEGFAGLKIKTDGTTITYSEYSHSKTYSDGYVSIGPARKSDGKTIDLGLIKSDESKTIDITDIIREIGMENIPHLFAITLMFGDDYDLPARKYLYYDGERIQSCRIIEDSRGMENMEKWNKLIGNLDPDKCLNMYIGNEGYPITYPTSGNYDYCNHVNKWCELSDEVIKKDSWSNEAKVFAMVLWLTRNCAYDNWRVHTNNNKSRATLAKKWNDDNLWMFYNHVGQCWDFANALTIMCRHQGIPCTSVENDHHTLNAVWLRNEWVAIDVSVLVEHECNTEDTDPSVWKKSSNWRPYRTRYGYYDGEMDTYNQAIATPATTVAGGGPNPM